MTTPRYALWIALAGAVAPAASAGPSYPWPGSAREARLAARADALEARREALLSAHPYGLVHSAYSALPAGGAGAGGSPLLEMLLSRYSLDATRFARYHPTFAPVLARIMAARSSVSAGLGYSGGIWDDTPLHNYLAWRWGLNPSRFDHYHPLIGATIEEDLRLRSPAALPPVASPGSATVPPILASTPGLGGEIFSPAGGGNDHGGNGGAGDGHPGVGGTTGGTTGGRGGGNSGGGGSGTPGGGGGETFPNPGPTATPEPAAFWLVGLGGATLAWRGVRARRAGRAA
jgi:hypothetical protein